MALNIQGLENHSGSGGGIKLWSYNSLTDAKAAVKGANYFDGAATLLSVGDRIFIKAADANFDVAVASISAAGVVVVAAVGSYT